MKPMKVDGGNAKPTGQAAELLRGKVVDVGEKSDAL